MTAAPAAASAQQPEALAAAGGDPDVASIALMAATSRPSGSKPLSPEEFRDLYQAAMAAAQIRRIHHQIRETAQQRAADAAQAPQQRPDAAPAAAGAAVGGRLAAVVGRQELHGAARVVWDFIRENFGFIVFTIVTALVISDGQRSHFMRVISVLLMLKLAFSSIAWASVHFRIRLKRATITRQVHPDDEYFSDDDPEAREVRMAGGAVGLAQEAQANMDERRRQFNRRQAGKRRWLVVRRVAKCCTTFVLCVFPKWKVENLHAELINEGLVRDESKRRPEAPQQRAA